MRAVLDLLLPPRCPACGIPVGAAVFCGGCRIELADLALPDLGLAELDDGVRAIGSYAYAGVVRDAILAVKAHGRHEALRGMGALMRTRLGLAALPADVAVTAVPTVPRVRRQRGVDVPHVLAGVRAQRLLRCVREDADQTGLTARGRRRAKQGAFAAIGPVPARVVLVDDVRTTGATALAAAAALREAGARRVLVATFAVAGDDARAAVGR
jgi:predicted amidophosphoribosyltransferase